ncbi:GNAT family N-acetyltransferase [Streptococcus caviae]|uniref:GNAT family N-acetyltransferase n=1 Tax=Streptococcus sp. 'caviae' TaxID=1915004 RepID=UPI00094B9837|nr:GNAT family N-acetyltransferase [Streptococcus sp. 'caviae']OLN83820.1 GNAT family N-acetyltransferase [Streptococcus sp. 'caviae']
MTLTRQKVSPFSKAYNDVKKLYLSAFPPNERLPYFLLLVNSVRSLAKCYAYYEQEEFVGFAYILESKKQVFILFLAVNEPVRSKGYGSMILAQIREYAGLRPLILTIEPPDKEAPNSEQRRRRLSFYERNGYQATSHYYYEGQECYQILTTDQNADLEHFQKLARRATLGFVPIEVR